MRKSIIVILIICLSLDSFTQPKDNLRAIAKELSSYQNYQSTCDYTFSMPFGDPMHLVTSIVTQKIPSDTLCGFYYDFEIKENERGEACQDFAIYFNNSVYNSYEGKVRKTSLNDNPEAFKELKISNGYRPAIQHSPQFYYITPYILAKGIDRVLCEVNAVISQKPDTIVNQNLCSQFLMKIENPNSSDGGKTQIQVIYELCFHKSGLYPVFYKKVTKSSYINSYQTAYFTDTKVNSSLLPNYFSEDNLLPKNWSDPNKTVENAKMNPSNLIGQNAPDWSLPVLGREEFLTNKSLFGKYILMEFTATWCAHCIKAAEMMNRLEDKFKNSKNLAILSIFSSNIDKKEGVLKFAEKLDLHSTILYSASQVGEKYNIVNYPNFFIISPNGKVLMNFPGYNEILEKNIINVLSEFADLKYNTIKEDPNIADSKSEITTEPPSPINPNISEDDHSPIYILDGVIVDKTQFKAVKPDDIKSISILRDKSVIDKYGEKAQNGVLLMVTKKNDSEKNRNNNGQKF